MLGGTQLLKNLIYFIRYIDLRKILDVARKIGVGGGRPTWGCIKTDIEKEITGNVRCWYMYTCVPLLLIVTTFCLSWLTMSCELCMMFN